jgi:hypothetical protein
VRLGREAGRPAEAPEHSKPERGTPSRGQSLASVPTRWRGTPYVLPDACRAALARVLEVPASCIDDVRVFERSPFARWHGERIAATTRRNAIYLRDDGAAFVADPLLMLHEYFHVVRQWRTGQLTSLRYLHECARRGYARNRYEVEARTFARDHVTVLRALLRP